MIKKLFTTASIVSSNRVLYTPSTFARSSLLHLQEIGELQALAPHTSKRDGLQSYLFFTVISGSGELSYDGKEYSLKPGSCVFIDCHKPYSHTTTDPLWTLKWIHFYGPSLPLIYEKYVERGGRPVFTPASTTSFLNTWEKLYEVAGSSDYIRDMRINTHLNALLELVMNESWDESRTAKIGKRQSLEAVKEYLDTHYQDHITLDQLSTDFFISKYYLVHTFKEQYGVSIQSYLQSVRITHAKQMLRFSDKSIEEIGLEIGIGELNYFSRVFKEVEGVPPSVYREQW